MDVLLTMLCAAGVNFVITVPGSDDVMLNYRRFPTTIAFMPARR